MNAPVFHLAIVDRAGNIRLVWPTVADAHVDLADLTAAKLHPRKRQGRRRRKTAAAIRTHLLELQQETVTVAAFEPEAAAPTD